jgi:hypothetical protein
MNDDFVINTEPPIQSNINDINLHILLQKWRDNMRDEINCLLFLKFKINHENNNFDNNIKEKYSMILKKLEELCTQEIDLINEGLINIKGSENLKNNPDNKVINSVLFDQIEYIRKNYNKIIEGINNTLISSIDLFSFYKEYYNKNINKNELNISIKPFSISKIEIPQISLRENEKNSDDLISEIQHDISDVVTDNYYLSNFSKINTSNILSGLASNQSEASKKVLSKFKSLLKLTKYKPKKKYQSDLTEIMSNKDIDEDNVNEYEEKNAPYRQLSFEIIEINKVIKNLKDQIYFNCIMDNEKKTFEKMKEDNINLNDEFNKLKDNLKLLDINYKFLLKKLSDVEEEQIYLQNENKKLIDYIEERYINKNINQKPKNNQKYLIPNSNQKILTSLGTESKSSLEMFKNIDKNLEKNNI